MPTGSLVPLRATLSANGSSLLISAHTNLTVALGCDGVTLVISLKVAVRYCEICTVVAMSFVGGAISTFIIYKMVFIDLFGG